MRPPQFLARRAYRRRRLIDAARFLPLLGSFLFLLPIFWSPQDTGTADTAMGGLYLFGVWFGLVVVAAALSQALERPESGDDAGDEGDENSAEYGAEPGGGKS